MNRKAFFIVIASLVFAFALVRFTLLSTLLPKVNDALFYLRGPLEDRQSAVVIVAIDEASLQKQGDWPWPRSLIARLIEKIKMGNPKVIGVDLLLDWPTRGKNGQREDGKLVEAFNQGPTCILPVVVKKDDAGRFRETLFKPLDIFLAGKTKTAVANVESDPADKITRQFKAMYGTVPSFPVALCLEYRGCSLKDLKMPGQEENVLINYKCARIDTISAGDVLEPFFNPAMFFSDKIVLVGRTDLASKDFVNTPVPAGRILETQPMSGIELWKEIIDMILAGNFLHELPAFLVLLIAALLSMVICACTLYSNQRGAVATLLCIGLCGLGFYYLFIMMKIVLPLLYWITVCSLAYAFSFLYNFVVFRREKRKLVAAFKSYISPQVLQKILTEKIDLSVGAQRKNLTVLFADIQGFTNFSDTQGPEEVLNFLKAFFAEMNQAILEQNGIVNKLMGDGIMAIFGDFSDSDTHAYEAVRAAVEMQKRVPDLQKKVGFNFQIRIGVHTGPVDVGNIGSAEHLDYTVIGRNVNLAQRLEANCEPGKILLSDATYQLVKDRVETMGTQEIPLKGFVHKVKVYTVRGLGG